MPSWLASILSNIDCAYAACSAAEMLPSWLVSILAIMSAPLSCANVLAAARPITSATTTPDSIRDFICGFMGKFLGFRIGADVEVCGAKCDARVLAR